MANTGGLPLRFTDMKKLFLILLLVMLFLPVASAFEFDNVKEYDANTREVTITNAFGLGDTIAKAKLITPQINYVMQGKDRKVAEITIDSYETYGNFIKEVRLINLKTQNTFERKLTYKYATYQDNYVNVPNTTREVCSNNTRPYPTCWTEVVTYKRANHPITTWTPLEKLDAKAEKITIGIFTDVYVGDNVEWIPTLFGVEVDEWATWTSSFNVDLRSYYGLNETTGTRVDNVAGVYNISVTGTPLVKTGIQNNSWGGDGDGIYGNMGAVFSGLTELSLSFWVYSTEASAFNKRLIEGGSGSQFIEIQLANNAQDASNKFVVVMNGGTRTEVSKNIQDGAWHNVVITAKSGDQTQIFVDGTWYNNVSTGSMTGEAEDIRFGGHTAGDTYSLTANQIVDEIAVWNRTLSIAEVTDLYNGGTGIFYNSGGASSSVLTATISSPINAYNTTSTTPTLGCNFTITGDENVSSVNISVWNITDSLVYGSTTDNADASSYNATWTTSALGDGTYTWGCSGFGSAGTNGTSGNRTFIIDTTAPTITLTAPVNQNYWLSGNNMTINWTASDLGVGLESCWISYNGNNYTQTCSAETSSFNVTSYNPRSVIFYANDTLGNLGSATRIWNYTIFQNAQIFNTSTIGSSLEGFSVNVSYDSSWYSSSITGILRYNNTDYSLTQSGDTFYTSVATPAVKEITNIQFAWNFTLIGASTSSVVSPAFTQEVLNTTGISVGETCGAGLNASITFTFKDEPNQTDMNGTANYNLKYGIYTPDAYVLNGTFTNVHQFSFCINSSNPTYQISYGEVQYGFTDYADRRFYLFSGTRATDTEIKNDLALLPNAQATSFQLEILKNDLTALVNYYTTLLRWYPSSNKYSVVEMGRTDNKGQTINRVKTEDVDYRIGVYNTSGSLIKLLDPIRMVCLTTPCQYSVFINLDSQDYSSFSKIQSTLTFNETTSIVRFTWNDPTQVTDEMNLSVYKGDNIVCSSSATGFTGILTCNLTGQEGELRAVAYRTASPKTWFNSLMISMSSGLSDLADGSAGIILALAFSVLLALIGTYAPVASLVLGILGMIPAMVLGGISPAVVIGFGILGGFVIWTILKRA